VGAVAVVTDSTAYLPPDLARRYRVEVVPLHVVLGGVTGAEGTQVSPAQVAAALREGVSVTTSRPPPAEFVAAYRRLLDAGAQAVLSLHLSAELSGTWDSARLAAAEVDPQLVHVVDSRTTAMGLGFPVLAAARAAADGGSLAEVEAAAERTVARTRTLFYVDTLEYLRRGGRMGAAAALLGTALSVKPLLHVVDGHIVVLERVRTSARAVLRLEELAVRAAAGDVVDVVVHHLAAGARAEAFASRLSVRLPRARTIVTAEVGAVVGAHVGPGLLGVAVVRH